MKIKFILCFCIAIVLNAVLSGCATQNANHPVSAEPLPVKLDHKFEDQIASVIMECQKIKPGMTRADLEKIFAPGGGISTVGQETFFYRHCYWIHVDVDFNPVSKDKKQSTDIILKISKPYLGWNIID